LLCCLTPSAPRLCVEIPLLVGQIMKRFGSNLQVKDWNSVRRHLTPAYWAATCMGGAKAGDHRIQFVEVQPAIFQRCYEAMLQYRCQAKGDGRDCTGLHILESVLASAHNPAPPLAPTAVGGGAAMHSAAAAARPGCALEHPLPLTPPQQLIDHASKSATADRATAGQPSAPTHPVLIACTTCGCRHGCRCSLGRLASSSSSEALAVAGPRCSRDRERSVSPPPSSSSSSSSGGGGGALPRLMCLLHTEPQPCSRTTRMVSTLAAEAMAECEGSAVCAMVLRAHGLVLMPGQDGEQHTHTFGSELTAQAMASLAAALEQAVDHRGPPRFHHVPPPVLLHT
jgi:hypothetical protein